MDGKRKRKRKRRRRGKGWWPGWIARRYVEEMQCPRVRARTRTYARAHIGTRLKVYICIDSVYNISIIDFFSLSLSN